MNFYRDDTSEDQIKKNQRGGEEMGSGKEEKKVDRNQTKVCSDRARWREQLK